jgi:Asp/Glu/hydantoin racemase
MSTCPSSPQCCLLVINPNTTASITERMVAHVSRTLGAASPWQVVSATARFGAPYIADEASYAVAHHACLDAWATALAEHPAAVPDVVLIGCFGDPGLWAMRAVAPCVVMGLAEASMVEAAKMGPFAIVTGGARWRPILTRHALDLGFSAQLAHIHTVAPSGAQLAADPAGACRLLAQACNDAIAQAPWVQSIILGGAGLAGLAMCIQPLVPRVLIDSVEAGARQAITRKRNCDALDVAGFDGVWQGPPPQVIRRGQTP